MLAHICALKTYCARANNQGELLKNSLSSGGGAYGQQALISCGEAVGG